MKNKEDKDFTIEKVKEQVINTSLVIASIVGGIAYSVSFISRIQSSGFNISILFESIVLALLLIVTLQRKRIGNVIKAYLIILLILFLALSDAFIYGLFSSTRIYLVLVPLYAIIYLPIRRSLIVYVFSIIVFVVFGYLHHRGILVIPIGYEPTNYILRLFPWIINAIHISTVGLIILYVTLRFFRAFSNVINDLRFQNIKIAEKEKNYREIFNSTSEAIFIHDARSGKILDVNDVMINLYGLESKDEALRLTVKDISASNKEDINNQAIELIRKAVEEGPQVFEWESKRKNGEIFYSEISLRSTQIGGEGRVLAVVRDISDRKKMEQSIQESEERYRTLVETSQDGISLMDMTGVMLFLNNRKAEMIGAKSAIDLVGQNAFELLTKESVEDVNHLMPKLLSDGYLDKFEAEVRRLNGTVFSAEFNVTILKDSKGNPKYIMDTMRDITERKEAEKALKESEQRYRTIIEAFPEIIMVSDLNSNIIFANKVLEQITGITPADYTNPNRKPHIHPDDFGYVKEAIKNLLSGPDKHSSIVENRFVDAWGKTHWFSGIISKIYIDNQLYLQTISRDITDKKKAEEELEKYRNHLEFLVKERTEELEAANEELYSTNEELYSQREELEAALNNLQAAQRKLIQSEKMASLGVLAAGIAHEINNPLNFIKGGVTALEDYTKENLAERINEVTPILSIINEGVNRAAEIVTGLNHYSRRPDKPTAKCDIHTIINNCILMLQNQTKNRIQVETMYCPEMLSIKCNEGKLHQAIINLLLNSVQSIDDKGVIKIKTKKQENLLQIIIDDSGCGISNDNLEKIFDPFFTTKDPGQGTGLGLSITQKIVEEHGGTLEFESEVGKGTKVYLNLPMK